MDKRLLAGLILPLAMAVALSSCSTTPPARTPYTGADKVQAVSQDMLLGRWNVKVLNPIEGEEVNSAIAHYREDGTVVIEATTNTGVELKMEMDGTWQVQGNTVVQQLTEIRETGGDPVAKLMMPLMNAFKDRMGGTADIYEATANRVVLVSAESGQAQELTRLP